MTGDGGSVIAPFDAWARERHSQQIPATQENTVSRIAAAKEATDRAQAALAGISANPLAEAIAETGAGATLDPERVRMVLGIVSVIERGGAPSTGFLEGLALPQPAFRPAPPQDGPGAPQGAV